MNTEPRFHNMQEVLSTPLQLTSLLHRVENVLVPMRQVASRLLVIVSFIIPNFKEILDVFTVGDAEPSSSFAFLHIWSSVNTIH
jgi:hypothetical protein